MNRVRTLMLVGVAALLCLPILPLAAQDSEESDGRKLEIIPLIHSEPHEVSSLVQEAFNEEDIDVMIDERGNQLIFRASPLIAVRIKELVAALDVVTASDARETALIAIEHRDAEELAQTLEIHTSPRGSISVDHTRNLLVVRDQPAVIASMRDLVKCLDVAPAQARLEFTILGPQGSALAGTPGGEKIVAELAQLGLGDYGVISRAMVYSLEGESFEIEENNPYRMMRLSGRLRLKLQSQQAELRLKMSAKPSVGDNTTVDINTTLHAPLGHFVVVGLAPIGEDGGKPLVLVARISLTSDVKTPTKGKGR